MFFKSSTARKKDQKVHLPSNPARGGAYVGEYQRSGTAAVAGTTRGYHEHSPNYRAPGRIET